MYDSRNFRRLGEILAARTGKTLRQVGREAVGAHGFFFRLDDERGCTLRTAERVQRYFEEVWPEGLDWPSDIPRRPPVSRRRSLPREREARP